MSVHRMEYYVAMKTDDPEPHYQHGLIFLNKFIYFWLHWVFVAARRLFSSCGERGLLFVVVHGLLIAVASLVVEHGL